MLKKRIAATLIVQNGIVVQSINFKKFLPIGKPDIAVEFLNKWGIDEIILLDISASKKNIPPDNNMVTKLSTKCYVPLTVGGGIKTIDHIKRLMHSGADKISLNQSALQQPSLITEAAKIFGDQCIVISIDAIKQEERFLTYDYLQKKSLTIEAKDFAKRVQELGAGEIYINSVDRDGSYLGYDLELIKSVCNEVSIPVICGGGAKNANDMKMVFLNTNVCAASAGNFYHFTEHSVNTSKANLIESVSIRLETHADYRDSKFDSELRLNKKEDQVLEEMLFIRIEKEII